MKANETQVGGDHYKKFGDYQPWEVLRHWLTPEEYRGWQKGVAIVYLARERGKGGDADIRKAHHHLAKLIEVLDEAQIESSWDDMANSLSNAKEQFTLDLKSFNEDCGHQPFEFSDKAINRIAATLGVNVELPRASTTWSSANAAIQAEMRERKATLMKERVNRAFDLSNSVHVTQDEKLALADNKFEKPWYPDDKYGPWIEIHGYKIPSHLIGAKVRYLTVQERTAQGWAVQDTLVLKKTDALEHNIVAVQVCEEAPWYPDDSGDWIESYGLRPSHLDSEAWVLTLERSDRESKEFSEYEERVRSCNWENVVAYKIVERAQAPWYPDDSGEWIETKAKQPDLPFWTRVEVMSLVERNNRKYTSCVGSVNEFWWPNSVAYKIVERAQTPWYPDDSGEWIETNGQEPDFSDRTFVEVLTRRERQEKVYERDIDRVERFAWSDAVAYRVVK